jgi:MFS family permease
VLAFDNPTRQALMPDLVDRSRLTSAISLNASVFTGAALIGPALAGALIPLVGPGGVFAVNTASYFVVLGALRLMSGVPERAGHLTGSELAPSASREQSRGREGSVLGTIAGGLAYVRGTPTAATLLLLSLLTGLLGRSFGPLLAVFARDVFEVGSFPFGLMVAAPGLGTLVGSLWLASRGEVAAKGPWVLVSTLGMSALLVAFAVAPAYALALPLLLLAGLGGTVASALTATMLQLEAPPQLRGRVMSYYTLTLIGVPALGTLLLGVVADAVGVRAAVAGAAALLAGLTVVVARRGAGLAG